MGEDEGTPGVVTYWEGLVERFGQGDEIRGVRGCGGSLVGDGEGDCTA